VEGIVEEVFVTEGDHVEAGQPIARLGAGSLVRDLETTEAEIRATRANLRKLEAGPRAEEIAVARAAAARARDAAEHARGRLARVSDLFAHQSATRAELDDADAAAAAAQHDQVEATRRLDILRLGTRPEEIAAARAQLDELETRRRYLEEQVRRLNVVSPVTGVVATPARQLHTMRQQLVTRGGLIAKVYDFRTVVAHLTIAEKEIGDVHVGQRVELRARAYPNHTFRGSVTAVAVAADAGAAAAGPPPDAAAGSGKAFIVTTRIDNDLLLLKPGMTGQGKVFCGPRRVAGLIARRVARTLKVEVWSWW